MIAAAQWFRNQNQKSEILYLAHWPTIISAYKYTYNVNGPWAPKRL